MRSEWGRAKAGIVHWYSGCSCCFFVKQKTAYEMRISDWSSDVCSSDLSASDVSAAARLFTATPARISTVGLALRPASRRSEEHTSELQSLMRISYAVFCLQKKTWTRY